MKRDPAPLLQDPDSTATSPHQDRSRVQHHNAVTWRGCYDTEHRNDAPQRGHYSTQRGRYSTQRGRLRGRYAPNVKKRGVRG